MWDSKSLIFFRQVLENLKLKMNSILIDQIPLQQLAVSSFEIQTDPNAGSNPEISATTQESFDIDKFLETNNAFLNATEKFQKEQVTIKVLEQILGHLLVRDAISSLTSLKNLKTLVDLMVKLAILKKKFS